MKEITIVKIGGNIVDDSNALQHFLTAYTKLEGLKILVHGGGKIASDLALKIGIVPQMSGGRRITDKDTLKIVTMVYAGYINKNLVAKLQAMNCDAIGLCGADAHLIQAKKRAIETVDFGYVGDLYADSIDVVRINQFLEMKLIPVFSAITHDGLGQLFNTNADTIASELAIALSKKFQVNLIYCFDKKGVLQNVEDPDSVITTIDNSNYQQLKTAGVFSAGMLPKIENARVAIQRGVSKVTIKKAEELLDFHAGTLII